MLIKFRKPIVITVDFLLINLAFFLAILLFFHWKIPADIKSRYILLILMVSFARLLSFLAFGLYEWSFRHTSIREAISVFKAITSSTLLLIVMVSFQRDMPGIWRSVLIMDYFICLFFIFVFRFFPRLVVNFKQSHYVNPKRLLIVGAGAAGELLVRDLANRQNKVYLPVGFIDDNPRKKGLRIHGIKVLGDREEMASIIEKHHVEEVIIAIPSAKGEVIRDIISRCKKVGTKFKILPGFHQILTGNVNIKQIREVKPEDLLGRDVVSINDNEIKSFIQDKTVLVTGAGGSIGSELCRQLVHFNPRQIIFFDYQESEVYFLDRELESKYPYIKLLSIIGDIKDVGLLKHVFSSYRPQVVFHSAAHKHVPLMERNPVSAVKNNIIGTRNLAYAASHYGVERFVLVSTDKAVNPTSVMGATKRVAEMLIQAKTKKSRTKFMAVRFGNVIGSSGSVVPLFKRQIENGGPVTITHPEIRRFFMSMREAAQLVLQAGALGKGGEVFVLDMGEPIKIADLAKNLITLSGLEVDKDIPVSYVGLRPGEKLFEETLHSAERDKATRHEKIFVAQPNDFNPERLRREIRILDELTKLSAEEMIIKKLKELVPEYSPNGRNSRK